MVEGLALSLPMLTQGTNVSAGVAILFAPGFSVNILSATEVVQGRVHMVRAQIIFCFVNIYASNEGSERVEVFKRLRDILAQGNHRESIVLGGDFNCIVEFAQNK